MNSFIPAPPQVGKRETPVEWFFERAPFPEFIRQPLFKAMTKVNKVVFKSAPAGDPQPEQPGSWRFSAIGDYGSGGRALTDVTNNIARTNPDLVVTMGDNVYWNGREKEFEKRWDPPKAFGDIRKHFPVLPSLGNHDIKSDKAAEPYFKRFPELNGARYYSYDHKGVHFSVVNSNESVAPGTPQYEWLNRDLAKADEKWKVMYFHHPIVSEYPINTDPLRNALGPVMAQHGVDLVLVGHEHAYARSKPLNDHGTIQVMSGGGGHTLYPFVTKQGKETAFRDVDYGHVNIEVQKDKLVGRYIVRDGTVKDTFVIPQKPAAVEQAAQGVSAIASKLAAPIGG